MNGEATNEVYKYLKEKKNVSLESPGLPPLLWATADTPTLLALFSSSARVLQGQVEAISWNFDLFLINKEGEVVGYYDRKSNIVRPVSSPSSASFRPPREAKSLTSSPCFLVV